MKSLNYLSGHNLVPQSPINTERSFGNLLRSITAAAALATTTAAAEDSSTIAQHSGNPSPPAVTDTLQNSATESLPENPITLGSIPEFPSFFYPVDAEGNPFLDINNPENAEAWLKVFRQGNGPDYIGDKLDFFGYLSIAEDSDNPEWHEKIYDTRIALFDYESAAELAAIRASIAKSEEFIEKALDSLANPQ